MKENRIIDLKGLTYGEFGDTQSTVVRDQVPGFSSVQKRSTLKDTERVSIALPTGELQKDVLGFMQNIGLDLNAREPRRYIIPVGNMPIDFVLIRASSIPTCVTDERSKAVAGITGSDILWESGLDRNSGQEIPIYDLNPNAKQSSLYIGITDRFSRFIRREKNRDPQTSDVSGQTIATKYVAVTKDFTRERSIENTTVFPIPGTDEAVQYIFPDYNAILGIISSGDTVKANCIQPLEIFYKVVVRLIEATDKMTLGQSNILNDLRERIAVALQSTGMIQ